MCHEPPLQPPTVSRIPSVKMQNVEGATWRVQSMPDSGKNV
jgi:hypothetical protein